MVQAIVAGMARPEFLEEGYLPTRILSLTCCAVLVAFIYRDALFGDGQFAFRDAGHFYYPLYYRVQQEWAAGHLPLWEPGENGGTPLLGSPMAAVLYPGKILFAFVPYAWGVRLYVLAHELLAFSATLVLARSWGISYAGASLAALSYAFCGPILSNHFNVIYLVGAAWIPLGFYATDRWLRRRRYSALAELAFVLAMQILGGDLECAYVTVLCAFGYAITLARLQSPTTGCLWAFTLGSIVILIGWTWIGPPLASWLHGQEPRLGQILLLGVWIPSLLLYVATRRRDHRVRLLSMLLGLAGSSALAITLAGIQILPSVEQIRGSVRWAGTGLSDVYDSSLLPYRMVEWLWPNVFGSFTSGNRYWMALLPPAGAQRPWPLSLYLGALPIVLAASAIGFRRGPAWCGWMSAVAFLSLLASLGEFTSPSVWLSRNSTLTPGDGSFYGLLITILPGLRLFRLPFKLLVFTSLALAILAGVGWDRIALGKSRTRVVMITSGLLALTALVVVIVSVLQNWLVVSMATSPEARSSVFGPLDVPGAVRELLAGLTHGIIALLASLLLITWASRHASWSGMAALLLLTVDLAGVNSHLVITVPQDEFERVPDIVQAIHATEKAAPIPGPFRVHRLTSWTPVGWSERAAPERLHELVRWEIDTLQPRFGLLHGVSYLLNDESRTEQFNYWHFFQPVFRRVDEGLAAVLRAEPGQQVLWHPRQAFDLWGVRYFILPSYPGDWQSPTRSYAAFLDQTELIYPDPALLEGPAHQDERMRWVQTRDVQVRRNKAAFPRAWVVHQAYLIRPLEKLGSPFRDAMLARLRYGVDSSRDLTGLPHPDFKTTAYIETDEPESLVPYLPQMAPDPAESVTVHSESATRIVLEANLRYAGLVVLADVYDQGWQLAIDGRPAPILRTNMLMRSAAVAAGSHILTYTYNPKSVRMGAVVSVVGWTLLFMLCMASFIKG
jgi:hypothetical protein